MNQTLFAGLGVLCELGGKNSAVLPDLAVLSVSFRVLMLLLCNRVFEWTGLWPLGDDCVDAYLARWARLLERVARWADREWLAA